MRILLAHNYYREPGGEDVVFEAEGSLLESQGHHVIRYTVSNAHLGSEGGATIAMRSIWNRHHFQAIRDRVIKQRVDVVHVHNTLPLISPSIIHAARSGGAAVVQSLHNYRLMCPAATLFRDGHICEECVGKSVAWPAVQHGCYRNSRPASAAVAASLAFHRIARTYVDRIDAFIALTQFGKAKFIQAGLPKKRIHVKPHFLMDDPMLGDGRGGYALFVGRLSAEKGISTLLDAWRLVGSKIPLKIVGDGPLSETVRTATEESDEVEWLGHQSRQRVLELMGRARMLIVPSTWYETFGLVVIEAFAKGTPVIVSDGGALAELVTHGRTGLKFSRGSAESLAEQARQLANDPSKWQDLRRAARAEFESKYSPGSNYTALLDIYNSALRRSVSSG